MSYNGCSPNQIGYQMQWNRQTLLAHNLEVAVNEMIDGDIEVTDIDVACRDMCECVHQ